jgi:3-hydroxymyristoyl/3-hydroxydecanoyl-(acyl carrier protein) dehydratase
MLHVEPRPDGFVATLRVDPAFSVLPDHFAVHPILPGMCLVQAVLLAGVQREGAADLSLRVLKQARFHAPALPGDELTIEGQVIRNGGSELEIKAQLTNRGQRVATISLVAQLPTVEAAPPLASAPQPEASA